MQEGTEMKTTYKVQYNVIMLNVFSAKVLCKRFALVYIDAYAYVSQDTADKWMILWYISLVS